MTKSWLLPRGIAARFFVSVCLLALPLLNARAQTKYVQVPGKASVKIDGTSTFHEWEMEGHQIGGVIDLPAGVDFDQANGKISGLQDGKLPAEVRAHISISTITSKAEHLPEVMNSLMQDNLKATDFPVIFYTTKTLTLTNSAPGKPFDFAATGDLAIAGVTNSITFPVSFDVVDATHLQVKGEANFKMTDFKITPPAPRPLGFSAPLKCGDDVTIKIDWLLHKK
jgi:polyisoprenoid-binding protein YceI